MMGLLLAPTAARAQYTGGPGDGWAEAQWQGTIGDGPNAITQKEAQRVALYPNPAVAGQALHITGMQHGRYVILSTAGQCLAEGRLQQGKLLLPALPAGRYVLRVDQDGTSQSRPFRIR